MSPILSQIESTQLLYLLVLLASVVFWQITQQPRAPAYSRHRRRPSDASSGHPCRGRKKAQWVRDEVIRLGALNPHGSCRTIAATFCAMYHGVEKVSKSWVAVLLRDEKYRVEVVRKQIRSRRPPILPRNRIWALDLTFVPMGTGTKIALGIIDHGTRACIALQLLPSKHSWVILRELANAVRRYGRPATVRTDNEVVFTSRLFRWGLRLLDIRHQRIEKLAPWQNGRIERFFGSFKACWQLFTESSGDCVQDLSLELKTFRAWYNHVRPHQHLDGRVPADVWNGTEPSVDRPHAYVSEWEEVLTGFHFR